MAKKIITNVKETENLKEKKENKKKKSARKKILFIMIFKEIILLPELFRPPPFRIHGGSPDRYTWTDGREFLCIILDVKLQYYKGPCKAKSSYKCSTN